MRNPQHAKLKSDYRYACYRAKKGTAEDALIKDRLAVLKPLLGPAQRWENFAETWDILIDKKGDVVIIQPEMDEDYIHKVCLEAKFKAEKGLDVSFDNDRQMNIVNVLETHMLDGLMDWNNYNEAWGVDIDHEFKRLGTKLYNSRPSQIEVTQEMIDASVLDADPSHERKEETPHFEVTVGEQSEMSPEQREFFEKNFLNKK